MPHEKLILMANQIGTFFVSQHKERAAAGVADHLKKFWDPRMRTRLVAYWRGGGEGLRPEVSEAIGLLAGGK
jgi:formate dehydrogenase subunit delta